MSLKPLLLAVCLLGMSGCHGGEPANPTAAPTPSGPAVAVRSQPTRFTNEAQFLTLTGTLRSRRQFTLSSRLSGFITHLSVEEGDRVTAGEVLARIDTADIEAQTRQAEASERVALAAEAEARVSVLGAQSGVSQAQAQVEAARRRLQESRARAELAARESQRQSFLAREGAVPRQRAEQALADHKVARAQVQEASASLRMAHAAVRQAQAQVAQSSAGVERGRAGVEQARSGVEASAVPLAYGELRAPFAGVVIRKIASQGEVTGPGKPLLEIQDADSLELALQVPESQAGRIQPRQLLKVELPSLSLTVPAEVRQIVASTDPATRNFEARLTLENRSGKLLPGMFGRVRLPLEKRPKLLVPSASLVRRGGLEGVFVVGPKAEFRLVKTGGQEGQQTEILSGLREGEKLVLDPPAQLVDGSPLEERP